MKTGKANVVIDLQWGSTGKGKLCAFLANTYKIDYAVCDFQPNAGHTFIQDGKKCVVKQVPAAAAASKDTIAIINPGAAIDVDRLLWEIEEYDLDDRLYIHRHAAIVNSDHRTMEKESINMSDISSTQSGVGEAAIEKITRMDSGNIAANEPRLAKYLTDTTALIHRAMSKKAMVLLEGAQGFDLSINHGWEYPYVTSRDVTTASILSNAGVPPQLCGTIYGTIRTYPIRVGHMYDDKGEQIGSSGPCYPDQRELTWEQITRMANSSTPLLEHTTVTGKVRRVFTFSPRQFGRALMVCRPTSLFVNFINYVNAADYGLHEWSKLSTDSKLFLADLEYMANRTIGNLNYDLEYIGTGPDKEHMIA